MSRPPFRRYKYPNKVNIDPRLDWGSLHVSHLYQIVLHLFLEHGLGEELIPTIISAPELETTPSLSNYIKNAMGYENTTLPSPDLLLGIPNFATRDEYASFDIDTILDVPIKYYLTQMPCSDPDENPPHEIITLHLEIIRTYAIVTQNAALLTWILDYTHHPSSSWEDRLQSSKNYIHTHLPLITDDHLLGEIFRLISSLDRDFSSLPGLGPTSAQIIFKLLILTSPRFKSVLKSHILSQPLLDPLPKKKYLLGLLLPGDPSHGSSYSYPLLPILKILIDNDIEILLPRHIDPYISRQMFSRCLIGLCSRYDDRNLFRFCMDLIDSPQQQPKEQEHPAQEEHQLQILDPESSQRQSYYELVANDPINIVSFFQYDAVNMFNLLYHEKSLISHQTLIEVAEKVIDRIPPLASFLKGTRIRPKSNGMDVMIDILFGITKEDGSRPFLDRFIDATKYTLYAAAFVKFETNTDAQASTLSEPVRYTSRFGYTDTLTIPSFQRAFRNGHSSLETLYRHFEKHVQDTNDQSSLSQLSTFLQTCDLGFSTKDVTLFAYNRYKFLLSLPPQISNISSSPTRNDPNSVSEYFYGAMMQDFEKGKQITSTISRIASSPFKPTRKVNLPIKMPLLFQIITQFRTDQRVSSLIQLFLDKIRQDSKLSYLINVNIIVDVSYKGNITKILEACKPKNNQNTKNKSDQNPSIEKDEDNSNEWGMICKTKSNVSVPQFIVMFDNHTDSFCGKMKISQNPPHPLELIIESYLDTIIAGTDEILYPRTYETITIDYTQLAEML